MGVSHGFLLLPRLNLIPRDVVGHLDVPWLIVSHGLKGIDKVYKFKTAINVLIKTTNPIDDIGVLELSRALKLCQKDAQVVCIDLPVRILVNHSEDR